MAMGLLSIMTVRRRLRCASGGFLRREVFFKFQHLHHVWSFRDSADAYQLSHERVKLRLNTTWRRRKKP